MTAIDILLVKIINTISADLKNSLPKKDFKVLNNLSKSVLLPSFITYSQSRLLIKLFTIHSKKMTGFIDEIEESLKNPFWSHQFREADEVKKISIQYNTDNVSQILVETHYSNDIKKALKELSNTITISQPFNKPKTYTCALTETNIVAVIEKLRPFEFTIDEELQKYYKIIKSWSKTEILSQFQLDKIENSIFFKKLSEEISFDQCNELVLADRSFRFSYISPFFEENDENLTNFLARRKKTTIWVDKKKFNLDHVFKSLQELHRFPVLIIFDPHDQEKCLKDLKNLTKILEKNEIFDEVGIYFRLDSTDVGKEFNSIVSEKKYNKYLDEKIKVVGIQNGKVPKFFIKNQWTPMSVVVLSNYLRNSKTAIYADTCDLIVVHTDNEPFDHSRILKWL